MALFFRRNKDRPKKTGYIRKRFNADIGIGSSRSFAQDARDRVADISAPSRSDLSFFWNGPTDGGRSEALSSMTDEDVSEISGRMKGMFWLSFAALSVVLLGGWLGFFSGVIGMTSFGLGILACSFFCVIIHHQRSQIINRRIMGLKETLFG